MQTLVGYFWRDNRKDSYLDQVIPVDGDGILDDSLDRMKIHSAGQLSVTVGEKAC